MSTFDGVVPEFPDISIDYFRKSPARPAPLVCFLSHVHSDHLQGLESFHAPFLYCSSATRELLLRLEKFPHRMNFQKGILESRRLHYRHLIKLLRPIPLHTPTEIELTPRRSIRVTLFDANHCPGAVMFLIEGDGKAIIYTGDIRAEPWWISNLVRQPVLIPYTLGQKRLDKLYLDTTFAGNSNPFRVFPSKAEGIAELLQKVDAYPTDTIFYFRSWTFGYEEVWMALSAALKTSVHLDRYQMRLYESLRDLSKSKAVSEGPPLCGYNLGNSALPGCLREDDVCCRIHSCEPGVSCPVTRGPKAVYITPIVNRTSDGGEIPEVGTGGGLGDSNQVHELEIPDETTLAALNGLCLKHIRDKNVLSQMQKSLAEAYKSKKKVLSLDLYGVKEEDEISLERLATKLGQGLKSQEIPESSNTETKLPNTIRFPYSRHSSYSELCELVAAFRPKDIHPCTVNESSWNEDVSIERLFGHLCSGNVFAHDAYMLELIENLDSDDERYRKRVRYDDENTQFSTVSQEAPTSLEYYTIDEPQKAQIKQTPPQQNQHQQQQLSSELLPLQEAPASSAQAQDMRAKDTTTTNDQIKAKRKEIEKAHRYLQEHCDPKTVKVGNLPSWASEDDNPTNRQEETVEILEHTTSASHTVQGSIKRPLNLGEDGAGSPQPDDTPPSPEIPDSQALSVSESMFAPSELDPMEPYSQEPNVEREEGQEEKLAPSPERARSRARARVAAYLAAREDNYDAWADFSLVSAGDNHNEEEIEL